MRAVMENMIWQRLLAVTVALFLLQLAVPGFTDFMAFTPGLVQQKPWTLVTAAFAHGGFAHLLFNMWALFIFGPILESKLGWRKFLGLYIAAAIAGNIGFAIAYPPTAVGVGASGALFGLIGALAVLSPNLIVLVFFAPMPLWAAAVLWAAIDLLGTLAPDNPIAGAAHLAGLAVGIAFGLWLKRAGESNAEDALEYSRRRGY